MIEYYLQKGVVITGFDFHSGTETKAPLTELSWDIREATVTLTESLRTKIWFGLRTKTQTTRQKVRFRFLPYVQGAINYCESQGVDVLSGFFSGCIMARYTRNNTWRVCHVSTGAPNDCQDTWLAIKGETAVKQVKEFKPHDHVTADKILGLITSTGKRFAIGCSAFVIEEKERRSVEQIMQEYPYTNGTSEKDKRLLAQAMAKGKNRIQALRVEAMVPVA